MKQTIRQGSVGLAVAELQVLLGVAQDGVFGPRTAHALRTRQAAAGLVADGICGPLTWAELGDVEPPLLSLLEIYDGEPPWLVTARSDLGVAEIGGPEAHPRIVEWFTHTTLRSTSDETPNCSAAVCAWLQESGVPSTRSARARSYVTWGTKLGTIMPVPLGAVIVFWRGVSRSTGQGHVGLYMGGDLSTPSSRVAVLGANQGDRCTIAVYGTDRLVGCYWPEGWELTRPESWLPLDGEIASEDWT